MSGIGLCVIAIILTISPNIGTNILSSALSYIVTPMQRGLNTTVSWAGGHFSALANNQRLITENRELQAEIYQLQLELFRLNRASEENEMLNAALNMQQRYAELPTMGARVIAQDPNDWHRSFRIDRGSNDGISVNMPVIASGGLAGSIRYVHPNAAQFVSVLDHRFYAAVTTTRTEDSGFATGDIALMNQNLLRMEHIEATAQIMPGDRIVTSPDSAIFPPGLLVGEVIEVNTKPDGLSRYAIIRPAADLNNLEIVLVALE